MSVKVAQALGLLREGRSRCTNDVHADQLLEAVVRLKLIEDTPLTENDALAVEAFNLIFAYTENLKPTTRTIYQS